MDSARARTWHYSTRLFSTRESARSQGHWISRPFVRGKKRKEKKTKDAKNGGRDANIFASRRSQRGESVQRRSVSVSDRWSHIHIYMYIEDIYAQRWNSRWRWITWPRFKARSPPSRVTLTRRASLSSPLPSIPPTFVSLIDATRARVTRNICGSTIDHARPSQTPRLRLTPTSRMPSVQEHV